MCTPFRKSKMHSLWKILQRFLQPKNTREGTTFSKNRNCTLCGKFKKFVWDLRRHVCVLFSKNLKCTRCGNLIKVVWNLSTHIKAYPFPKILNELSVEQCDDNINYKQQDAKTNNVTENPEWEINWYLTYLFLNKSIFRKLPKLPGSLSLQLQDIDTSNHFFCTV